ncbi:MAG: thioredoxin reductase [Chloroflexota bacterium]|jgi:thioredoxin reductase (NADPH)|nr:thioredoxin reductase [Chloroflexota bacterium]
MSSTPERGERTVPVDCLVVGGGPAGLAAAIQLGRLRRSSIVVDDDAGRSLWSQVTRNHLGFPAGVSAADLRLLGQRQAVNHDVGLRNGQVVGLRRAAGGGEGFVATVTAPDDPEPDDEAPGLVENRIRERRAGARLGERPTRRTVRIRARTVLLATGVVDAFPSFEGRDECVGVSLFWCIICDGYESIGRHVAVVGDDEEAIATAFGLLHFTERVTLVTGRRRTRADPERLRALERRRVAVIRGAVGDYRHEGGQIQAISVRVEPGPMAGPTVECEMVFVSTPKRPRTELARRLGASADAAGYLLTDDSGRTSIAGLYAAGDNTAGHSHQVTTAAHLGAKAATAVNWDLYDDVERGHGGVESKDPQPVEATVTR